MNAWNEKTNMYVQQNLRNETEKIKSKFGEERNEKKLREIETRN